MSSNGIQAIENRLWAAADELRANSKLKASEYSVSIQGLRAEELAVLDILTRPSLKLSAKEKNAIKQVAQVLLARSRRSSWCWTGASVSSRARRCG